MKTAPALGTTAELHWQVSPAHLISLGANHGSPLGVFSTPSMILLMELTARQALAPFLEEDEEQVGSQVSVEHLGGALEGDAVRGVATIVAVDGRKVDFVVEAFRGPDLIGRGTHRRTVVSLAKLRAKLSAPVPASPPVPAAPVPPKTESLILRREGGALWVTLQRPRKLNAIDRSITLEISALRQWLQAASAEVRVVVLQGAGGNFCAGDDLRELSALSPDEAMHLDSLRAENCVGLTRLPQVFIASIEGACFGGGFMLAACCDFRFSTFSASFGLPEVSLGWPPAYGNQQVIGLVGLPKALDWCLSGRTITAREASDAGLVNQLASASALPGLVSQQVAHLLAQPPAALRETKQLLQNLARQSAPQAHLADLAAYHRCLQTPEAKEGIQAFLEKRPRRPSLP